MSCDEEETVNLKESVAPDTNCWFGFFSPPPEFKVKLWKYQTQPRHSVGVALKRQLQTSCPLTREVGMGS